MLTTCKYLLFTKPRFQTHLYLSVEGKVFQQCCSILIFKSSDFVFSACWIASILFVSKQNAQTNDVFLQCMMVDISGTNKTKSATKNHEAIHKNPNLQLQQIPAGVIMVDSQRQSQKQSVL